MVDEKVPQHVGNTNNSTMMAINNFPSCSAKLPSCDQVAVMVPAEYHDGNSTNHVGKNITASGFPSWSNTVKNQAVKVNHDGNDGIFTTFNDAEIIPINSTEPPKPKMRIVV